jgi:hypothetical protein
VAGLFGHVAHCGSNVNSIRFGESSGGGSGRSVGVSYCATNPGYNGVSDQGEDWAFCVLDEPVNDIPVIPPAVGCESEVGIGQTVVMVGYGDAAESGGYGTKRYAQSEVSNVMWDQSEIYVGPMSPNACPGDSGGPLLIKYADDSWRTIGIASTLAGDCGTPGAFNAYALVRDAIPWVEETTGIDVTPCHDADGTWNPSSECTGFWTGDQNGFGSWNDWCSGTPAGGPSSTCGPDFNQEPETIAPTITITSPEDGAEFTTDGGTVAITINAVGSDDDGDEWGVQDTQLMIDGTLIEGTKQTSEPYEWTANFPSGEFDLQIVAHDFWQNEGLSNVVTVYIDQAAPESTTTNGTTASTDDGDSGADATAGEGDGGTSVGEVGTEGSTSVGSNEDGGGSGCSCDARRDGRPLAGLALLGLIGLGRRRRGS